LAGKLERGYRLDKQVRGVCVVLQKIKEDKKCVMDKLMEEGVVFDNGITGSVKKEDGVGVILMKGYS